MLEYVLMGLFLGWSAIVIPWFLMRRQLEPIASRGWQSALVSCLVGVVFFVLYAVYGEVSTSGADVSCFFLAIPSIAFVPAWWGPYCSRCCVLYYKNHEQRARLNSFENPDSLKDREFLIKYKWILNSKIWFLIFFLFFLMAFGALMITVWVTSTNTTSPGSVFLSQPTCNGRWSLVLFIEAILCVIITLVFCFLLFDVRDNYGLKSELRNLVITIMPVIILWAIQLLVNFAPGFPNHAWPMLIIFFGSVGSIFIPTLSTYSAFYASLSHHYARKSSSHSDMEAGHMRKISLDLLPNHMILEELLRNSNFMTPFKAFAADCWCIENVMFYEDVRRYSLLADEASLKREAQRMVSIYIEPDSPMLLNLDGYVLATIQTNVRNNLCSPSLFADAEQKVLHIILNDTIYKWRQTKGFVALLKTTSLADRIDFDSYSSATSKFPTLRIKLSSQRPELVTHRSDSSKEITIQVEVSETKVLSSNNSL